MSRNDQYTLWAWLSPWPSSLLQLFILTSLPSYFRVSLIISPCHSSPHSNVNINKIISASNTHELYPPNAHQVIKKHKILTQCGWLSTNGQQGNPAEAGSELEMLVGRKGLLHSAQGSCSPCICTCSQVNFWSSKLCRKSHQPACLYHFFFSPPLLSFFSMHSLGEGLMCH